MEPALLIHLLDGPSHGYALLAELESLELGPLDPSVVYRFLREMEEDDWVSSSWDEKTTQGPPRRVYEITPAGRQRLAEWTQELQRQRERIDQLLEDYKTKTRRR